MRDRIWAELQDKKFQEIYTDKLAKKAHFWGGLYSLFLVVSSAGSVAAWNVWQLVPGLWGTIVAISQFLHLAKPYIPHIKYEREYIQMSLSYGAIYLLYEELWCDFEKDNSSVESIKKKYHDYRRKDLEISKKFSHVHCPERKKLMDKCSVEANRFLQRHY